MAKVLRLEQNSRLSRPEFERRYAATPNLKRAELVEGKVYIPERTSFKHAQPRARVVQWLGAYALSTSYVGAAAHASVRLDLDNEPQPDALLRLEPEVGGTSSVSVDDYIEGPPELVVEIAASTVSYDLHDKLRAYRRNAVKEYLVWRVEDKAFDWFVLDEGRYVRLEPQGSILASRVFPGLVLHVDALLRDDMASVMRTLQSVLQGAAHTEFIERLNSKGDT